MRVPKSLRFVLALILLFSMLNVFESSEQPTGQIAKAQTTECNPVEVTKIIDDGTCGTLRYAVDFLKNNPNHPTKTISFTLEAGSIIQLQNSGLNLPAGASINGRCETTGPGITINGTDIKDNGLTLNGGSSVNGLAISGFEGAQLKIVKGPNQVKCVQAGAILPSSQDLIYAALQAGKITYPQSLIYRGYAFFNDPRLPAEYRGGGSDGADLGFFAEIQEAKNSLPADVVTQLKPYLVRPGHPASVFSVAPSASRTAAGASCAPGQWTSKKPASALINLKVWVRCTDNPTQDQARLNAIVQMANLYYNKEVDFMKGQTPIRDLGGSAEQDPQDRITNDDDAVDIYLLESNGSVKRNDRFNWPDDDVYGVVIPTEPTKGHGTSGFMLLPVSTVDGDRLATTFTHELFHLLQFASNHDTWGSCPEGNFWFGEASATWASTYFVPEKANDQIHIPRFKDIFQDNRFRYSLYKILGPQLVDKVRPSKLFPYAAYIYPYFMQQEIGAAFIADAWEEMASAGDCSQLMNVLDSKISFKQNFHQFTLRNLNQAFGGANEPLQPRYKDVNPAYPFPDNVLPRQARSLDLMPARARNAPPITEPIGDGSIDLPSLTAYYAQYNFEPEVKQVTFDFTGFTPVGSFDIDAVVKIKGKPWEVRNYTGQDKVKFCFDKPEENLEQIYFVITNHDKDPNSMLKGNMKIYPLNEGCQCGDVTAAAKGWKGTLTMSWDDAAFKAYDWGGTQNITVHHDVSYSFVLNNRASYIPGEFLNWTGLNTPGTATVNDTTTWTGGTSPTVYTTKNTSGIHPDTQQIIFNLKDCTFSFRGGGEVALEDRQNGKVLSTRDNWALFANLLNLPIPADVRQITYNTPLPLGTWPYITPYFVYPEGQGIGGLDSLKGGRENINKALVSWKLEPLEPLPQK